MSVAELKEILIDKIKKEDDEQVLLHAIRILEHENILNEPEVIYLTEEQKKGIEEARQQFKDGLFYTHEEVMQEMKNYLTNQKMNNGEKD